MNIYKNDETQQDVIDIEMNDISVNQIQTILQLARMQYESMLEDERACIKELASVLSFNKTDVNKLYDILMNKYNRDLVITIKNRYR
jgi:arsenate reductase-like glutaredoxin family protein